MAKTNKAKTDKKPSDTTPPPPADLSQLPPELLAIIGPALLLAAQQGTATENQILQLPTNFLPPLRQTKTGGTNRPGLVDQYGNFLTNQDGTIKTQYNDEDILGWYNLPFATRKRYGDLFKKLGLYGSGSPSPTYDQQKDLNVFAVVLNTANVSGLTWRAALPVIEERMREVKTTGTGGRPPYRPSALADIKSVLEGEMQQQLGRVVSAPEMTQLAKTIQQQETRQQTRMTGPQPIATRTLIERGVEQRFGPEAEAYRFAQFAKRAFGEAGSGEGVTEAGVP